MREKAMASEMAVPESRVKGGDVVGTTADAMANCVC